MITGTSRYHPDNPKPRQLSSKPLLFTISSQKSQLRPTKMREVEKKRLEQFPPTLQTPIFRQELTESRGKLISYHLHVLLAKQ